MNDLIKRLEEITAKKNCAATTKAAIKWDKERLEEIRKTNARNLELQSELEEEKRRNALLRQMNEKLRRAQ